MSRIDREVCQQKEEDIAAACGLRSQIMYPETQTKMVMRRPLATASRRGKQIPRSTLERSRDLPTEAPGTPCHQEVTARPKHKLVTLDALTGRLRSLTASQSAICTRGVSSPMPPSAAWNR